MSEAPDAETAALRKGLRIDLVVATGALVLSMAATGIAWWQTSVIRQQLDAQVWPYVSLSAGLDPGDTQISIENDGLGPAVLESFVISVDGRPRSNIVDVMHAVLGERLSARSRAAHESLAFHFNESGRGSVLRPGQSTTFLHMQSRKFSRLFAQGFDRVAMRICYCAIVPGECWLATSQADEMPVRVHDCPAIKDDMLHQNLSSVLGATL